MLGQIPTSGGQSASFATTSHKPHQSQALKRDNSYDIPRALCANTRSTNHERQCCGEPPCFCEPSCAGDEDGGLPNHSDMYSCCGMLREAVVWSQRKSSCAQNMQGRVWLSFAPRFRCVHLLIILLEQVRARWVWDSCISPTSLADIYRIYLLTLLHGIRPRKITLRWNRTQDIRKPRRWYLKKNLNAPRPSEHRNRCSLTIRLD